jgi:hypothetical protein
MPNQSMCMPGRRANKQANKVSGQSRNSRETKRARAEGRAERKAEQQQAKAKTQCAPAATARRYGGRVCIGAKMRGGQTHTQSGLQDALRRPAAPLIGCGCLPSPCGRGRESHMAAIHLAASPPFHRHAPLARPPPFPLSPSLQGHALRLRRLGLHTLALCSARLSANSRGHTHIIHCAPPAVCTHL